MKKVWRKVLQEINVSSSLQTNKYFGVSRCVNFRQIILLLFLYISPVTKNLAQFWCMFYCRCMFYKEASHNLHLCICGRFETKNLAKDNCKKKLKTDHFKKIRKSFKSRYFTPKLDHWNTPIDRALNMRFNDGSGNFLRTPIFGLWKFLKSNCAVFWT